MFKIGNISNKSYKPNIITPDKANQLWITVFVINDNPMIWFYTEHYVFFTKFKLWNQRFLFLLVLYFFWQLFSFCSHNLKVIVSESISPLDLSAKAFWSEKDSQEWFLIFWEAYLYPFLMVKRFFCPDNFSWLLK